MAVWCIGFEGGNYEEKALVNAVVQITLEYEIIFIIRKYLKTLKPKLAVLIE